MVKIIDLTKRSKRYYLVGKEVDQAKAVSELFDEVLKDPKVYISDLTDELISKYDLRKEKKDSLKKISQRLKKAKDIVQAIRSKSKSAQEFYKSFFGTEMPSDGAVRTEGFAVCVYLPDHYFQKDVCGEAIGFKEASLEEILKYNLKQLNGKRNFKDLQALSFKINATDPIFQYELRTKGLGKTSVERHELKHIIDSIISEKDRTAEELSADLFAGDLRTADGINSLTINADLLKKKIQKLEQKYLQMNKQKLPKTIKEPLKMSINSYKLTLEYLEKFPFELIISEAEKEGVDYKTLSYIVSMTPFTKLEHRLKLIVESFKRKKELISNREKSA